jgi:hypothetical protein
VNADSVRRRAIGGFVLAAAISVSGCGSASRPDVSVPSTPAPVPSPSPAPSQEVASLAGQWLGTLESSNFAPRTISLEAFQTAINCVDGAWASVPQEWAGAISGLTGVGSFSGFMSFEGSGGCTGIASVSGDVGVDSLTWTSTGFTAGKCPQGTPQSVVIRMRRR